jgi:23S rRNA (adenine1618-N6)-methyltransferase
MSDPKKEHPKEKARLHPRNPHRERYDFALLTATCPDLLPFVTTNRYGDASVDFADPDAVKTLNKALLQHYYDVKDWDIPEGYLCPPIPGRADYIHYAADLLRQNNYGKIPTGSHIKCMDIGVGANCVYPIIGQKAYDWSFIGSDIDPIALASANAIIGANPHLQIETRLQANPAHILQGVMQKEEFIDLVVCNPPFHASLAEAQAATLRKVNNLNANKNETTGDISNEITTPVLNFGGQETELCCEGGELGFIQKMIHESRQFRPRCFWYSTLVSKQANLNPILDALEEARVMLVEVVPMGQGNKTSRMVAWTYLTTNERQTWKNSRWNPKK